MSHVRLIILGITFLAVAGFAYFDGSERKDPRAAYELLTAQIANLTPQEQHSRVHIFSENLFSVIGPSAINVCDEQFDLACYHQVSASYFAAAGFSAAPKLYAECSETYCKENVGRSILSFIGYKKDDTREALALCETLADPALCRRGAVEEFSWRTMLELYPHDATSTAHERCVEFESVETCDELIR